MNRRRAVLVTVLAVTLTGGTAAGVLAAQRNDACDNLRDVESRRFDSFEEQQRVQAETLAACLQKEHEQNVGGQGA